MLSQVIVYKRWASLTLSSRRQDSKVSRRIEVFFGWNCFFVSLALMLFLISLLIFLVMGGLVISCKFNLRCWRLCCWCWLLVLVGGEAVDDAISKSEQQMLTVFVSRVSCTALRPFFCFFFCAIRVILGSGSGEGAMRQFEYEDEAKIEK